MADRLARGGRGLAAGGQRGPGAAGLPRRARGDIDLEVAAADAAARRRGAWAPRGRERRAAGAHLAAGALRPSPGVEVDVTAGLAVGGPRRALAPDVRAAARVGAPRASCAGGRSRVAPVEETLARALVLGDWAALARSPPQAGAAGGAARRARPTWRSAWPRPASSAAR